MPALKDLVCHVQWANTGSPFPEYGTAYGDGLVETYIAIPGHPQVLTIHLTSRKFISEGLAMVVFIDGQYQCNRNRVNLEPEKKGLAENMSKVDFLVRQKEKPLGDGTYMGREWRFDDYNLVSQLPEGTDETHFKHLGSIEVLVLRCRSKHTYERAMSTASSAGHSALMDDTERTRVESDAEADDGDKKSRTEKQSDKAENPQAEAEAEGGLGGFFGIFDGSADERPLHNGHSVDGPFDGYYEWSWQPQGRPAARYGPQQGPHYLQNYRPAPAPYEEVRQPRYIYYDSPPPSAYARPVSPPPRARRVHFDYGDGRGPQHGAYHPRYEQRLDHAWERDDRHEYSRTRPSYHDPGHHRDHNPYADYPVPPERGHYMYDADRKAYIKYSEPQQAYSDYKPRSTPSIHPAQQIYAPPNVAAPQSNVHAYAAGHHMQHTQGPPPFAASHTHVPNPVASVPQIPPIPPKVPLQPPHLPSVQSQPVHYPIPVWVPPTTVPVPPLPGPIHMYPPPGNQPLFHAQGPSVSISGPGGPPGQQNNTTTQQQGGENAHDLENNSSDNIRYDNISDLQPNRTNSDGGNGGADSGGNDNTNWAGDNKDIEQKPATDLPDATNNDGGEPNKNNQATDWAPDNSNGAGDGWGNNDKWNNDNGGGNNGGGNNGGGGWDNNNNTSNDNGQGWDNNNTGNNSWEQNNQSQNDSSNQQGGNDNCWANDNQNNQNPAGGNDQSNTSNNNQDSNPTPNNQPNNWNNEQKNALGSSSQPTPEASRSNSRSLYGPYGAYYASKPSARSAPPPDAEEEPRYDVPQAIAQSKGVTKQVQPGPGYLYTKKRCAPHYIDSLDEPYAKFVFKYRTKEQLKNEIGVEITAEPTGDEEVNALETLDKAELIQMVLRAKGALGGTIPDPIPKITPPSANGFEPVPVLAPDVSFLGYSLPPMRKISNNAGLGIRLSNASSHLSNAGNANQNNNWNGNSNGGAGNGQDNNQQNNGFGAQNWQENAQQQNNNGGNNQSRVDNNAGNNNQGWGADNNSGNNNQGWGADNNAGNNSGWDGQQERKPSLASQPSKNSSMQSQGTVQHNNAQQQNSSRRSSAISPKNVQGQPSRPSHNEQYERLFATPQSAMPGPPPPPPITIGGEGTVGGGVMNWDTGISGAGPRPPTPTGPPPPPSPAFDSGGGGTFGGWGGVAAQPSAGW